MCQASDAISTGRLLVCIVDMLGELKQWQKLNEHLIIMSKKRTQLKQAVTKMVQAAMKYVDEITNEQIRLNLINTLRTVTEGKVLRFFVTLFLFILRLIPARLCCSQIYVEVERARLTRILAQIKESKGLIEEAADVLQEVKVETFGSMEKREKVEFILEQMRLCLAKKDYSRTQILSRKISPKFFQEDGTEDLKLKYYRQMIEVDIQQDAYLAISKHFWEIYNTKLVQEDSSEKRNVIFITYKFMHTFQALCNIVVYLILSPYDNEQNDLMHRRMKLRDLETLPEYVYVVTIYYLLSCFLSTFEFYFSFSQMLKAFTTQELVNWNDFRSAHEKTLISETLPFSSSADPERSKQAMKALQERVTEHNIRVISAYYTQIRLVRLAQLLDLSVEVGTLLSYFFMSNQKFLTWYFICLVSQLQLIFLALSICTF